jgi:hypothetical protein
MPFGHFLLILIALAALPLVLAYPYGFIYRHRLSAGTGVCARQGADDGARALPDGNHGENNR